jgi:nephrocystin-3
LRRIIEEIRARYVIDQPVPEELETLRADFPLWLARVTDEKLVLIIDGLNYLNPSAGELEWLPKYVTPQLRLIVSSMPGPVTDYLHPRRQEAGWHELELKQLDRQDRETLAVRYLGEHHKALSRGQLEHIVSEEKCAHPLFLKTLLEELRLFGSFTQLNERIDRYLGTRDLDDLMQNVLERIEQDYGERFVSEMLSLVWASRYGLTETELAELLTTDTTSPSVKGQSTTNTPSFSRRGQGVVEDVERQLNVLLTALEYHLMLRNGRLTFSNDYLREAVAKRYLAQPVQRNKHHRKLAEYYKAKGDDPYRAVEEPWQWLALAERQELIRSLTDWNIFSQLSERRTKNELLRYWLWAAGNNTVASIATEHYAMMSRSLQSQLDTSKFLSLLKNLAEFFNTLGAHEQAESYAALQLELALVREGTKSAGAAAAYMMLGSIYTDTARYTAAEESLGRALEAVRSLNDIPSQIEIDILEALSQLFYTTEQYAQAEAMCRGAIVLVEQLGRPRSLEMASIVTNLGAILLAKKDLVGAEKAFKDALDMRISLLGPEDALTGQAINNIGALLSNERRYAEAAEYISRALAISRRVYGPNHLETAVNMVNLAHCIARNGNHDEAVAMLHYALSIQENILGGDHPSVAMVLSHLGRVEMIANHFTEAATASERAALIRVRSLGPQHSLTAVARIDHATALIFLQKAERAKEIYDLALKEVDPIANSPLLDESRARYASAAVGKLLT